MENVWGIWKVHTNLQPAYLKGPVADFCEHNNEKPGSIKDWEFLNLRSNCPFSRRTLLRGVRSYLILVPASEHGCFISSRWRIPLRHPPKVIIDQRFYFQQTSGALAPVGKRKDCSLFSRSPAPIADRFHVATMARKHSVLNLREINRNNTHTALACVLTYYGWVSLIL
jgi:hypothetical protein